MTGKLYVNSLEDLNDYEREHNRISYARLCNRVFSDMILCNNISNIDNDIWGNVVVGADYFDKYGNDEIYQYYIVNLNIDYEYIQQQYGNNLIIAYSNLLDCYILLVDHYGTSWDYVLTDIEPTTEL